METKHFEFSEHENLVIKKLFSHMNFVGISLLVLGGLFALFDVYMLFSSQNVIKELFVFVLAFVVIVMGVITIRSANSFKRIVKTEGDDIEHLIQAIDKLTTWFSIVTTLILISAGVLILGFVAYLSI